MENGAKQKSRIVNWISLLRFPFGLYRMRKWSGGVVILVLVLVLVMSYSLRVRETRPKKQTAYDFFHPVSSSEVKNDDSAAPPKAEEKKVPKSVRIRKPHFVNMAGLSDLYALRNVSKEESKALVLWPHLHSVLSRSDALGETRKGIKEASVAWKELVDAIEKEKVAKSRNVEKLENCPFSVSTLDKRLVRGRNILELPCGLVEDSSITLLGIPHEHGGSFEIELVGSNFARGAKVPVILQYNVNLPGDNMTEAPFIVQNTWTNEFGWGKEEKCPSHGSGNNLRVDGLSLCNERGAIEENQNSSLSSGTNISRENVHGSSNFPFVEGSPFTATLWAGLEGFHMTVNGRHETSFAYREKLEPWAVNEVKVSGNLDLLSALAKGLPVSEDHELIVTAERLKAPVISRKRLLMLVGVFSNGNNFERRMALRRSWMQYEAVLSGDVAVRFFIGLNTNKQVNYELWKEANAYGDIQFMPFVDYYSLITLKTIAICIMGTKILPAKYIMKTDDDAFVRIDEVISSLKGQPSNGLLYGMISLESSPHREQDSKWYISEEEWPHDAYPPWAHGPGYIISRDIAKFIVRGHHDRDLQLFKLEDVAMGIWIQQFNASGQEVHYINDDRFYNAGCDANYVLAHYQNPRMVLCLWENLQKEKQAFCCE